MFREVLKASPLAIGLTYALWQNTGVPFGWALTLATFATPTIWLLPLLKKELSRR
jgi:hypothetical protein